jgi:hypothetical protein
MCLLLGDNLCSWSLKSCFFVVAYRCCYGCILNTLATNMFEAKWQSACSLSFPARFIVQTATDNDYTTFDRTWTMEAQDCKKTSNRWGFFLALVAYEPNLLNRPKRRHWWSYWWNRDRVQEQTTPANKSWALSRILVLISDHAEK